MKISEIMTPDVRVVAPVATIQEAAALMVELDIGALPVSSDEGLLGIVTDRDIATRAVANGLGPETPVSQIMSESVTCCFDDEDVSKVASDMGQRQIRRLPVLDRANRLVGMIALGDIAVSADPTESGEALSGISEPGGAHNQGAP